jgi:hypothetical protein
MSMSRKVGAIFEDSPWRDPNRLLCANLRAGSQK